MDSPPKYTMRVETEYTLGVIRETADEAELRELVRLWFNDPKAQTLSITFDKEGARG